jgi:hypothetical protein
VIAAARQALRRKVRRIVVGTHGRSIEQGLLEQLSSDGWVMEAEETCRYGYAGKDLRLAMDGCQVWRNPAG